MFFGKKNIVFEKFFQTFNFSKKIRIKCGHPEGVLRRFFNGQDLRTKFNRLNDFFKRRASYHFKAQEFRNLRAF